MIKSPWETATALLTVEREGIRRYERFTLQSTQQTVEIPIGEADIPNVFVSVLLVKGRLDCGSISELWLPICSFHPSRAETRNTAAISQRSRHSFVGLAD